MAVLQMQKISICALKKDRKAILEKLQSLGVLEIQSEIEDDSFQKLDTGNARQSFEKKAHLAERGLEILGQYVPEKTSMLSGLEGKRLIEEEQLQKTIEKRKELTELARRLDDWKKQIAENKANILKVENQIEGLIPWMKLDVPMNYRGTKTTAFILGTMAAGTTVEEIYRLVAEHASDVEAVDVNIIASDKDAVYLAVLCLKKDAETVENALRAGGFSRPSNVAAVTPKAAAEELEKEKEQLETEIQEITKKIEGEAGHREELKMLSDYYRMRADKYEVLGKLPQSQNTFFVGGYIAEKSLPLLQKTIGERYHCVIDVEEIKEEEEPPVILSNNTFSESVEGVLESYGLPRKGEIDPTTIMSFFYVFFFGMMLSDAAYGAIMFVACFVVLKKYPRMGESLHKSLKLFMYCGISTFVWGVLFGGYFGNVVDIVSQTFFGKTVTIPALWFVPLNDPMKLLVYSMLFGVIHLFVGHGIKGYMALKAGKPMDFFCDVVLWYFFLIGLILMLLPTDIFASIAQTQIVFPPIVNTLAKALTIIGAVGILLMSGRDKKNPALRLALGAYDIYNITGWLSDVLSYSRLLALGLATGVIASVINQMASMFGGGILGAIGFIVVFLLGHTINLAINLLGAYVHTNRLQFVEFFGKFYEGGGKPFEPFKADTKYVTVQDSEQKVMKK